MDEELGNKENASEQSHGEVFGKAVRAGRRTYFFDVKATRRNDYYLTITESKRRFNREGKPYYEKHKVFLYKEDFEKFVDGLNEALEFIKEEQPELEQEIISEKEEESKEYTDIAFEDLDVSKEK